MGVIKEAQQKRREAPEFPEELSHIYWHYKRVRFGRAVGDDVITLVPRPPLQYAELESYNRMLADKLTPDEIEVIMDIDAIFEMREVK